MRVGHHRHRLGAARAARVATPNWRETVDTSDEWIVERTGIRFRHIAGAGETTATLAADAARAALARGGHRRRRDRPDRAGHRDARPDLSGHARPRCRRCWASTIASRSTSPRSARASSTRCRSPTACCARGAANRALVIGAETFSRILDWEDRATCVLFGDGAGAVVLEAQDATDGERGILATRLHADGRHNELLYVDGGPSTTGTVGKLRMKGREVFRHAVVNLAAVHGRSARRGRARPPPMSTGSCRTRPMRASSTPPRASSGSRPSKVVVTVDQHANTSAASVPLALDVAVRDGRIKPGQIWSCSRRWAAASPGARRWYGSEADCYIG